jgi:hypothetical protein
VLASRTRPIAVAAACALLLAGCYSLAEPSFRPGDARDLLMSLARRGVEVRSSVTGASACSDPTLASNALRMVVTTDDDPEPRDVWVYTFRIRSWEASEERVDACEAEYAALHPGASMTRVDVPVFRVFGADWSPSLADAVRGALDETSVAGL